MQTGTIGQRFDRAPNAFHLLRLLLAIEVVAWHALTLRGGHLPPAVEALVKDVGVDCFFALSGFLITAAWVRHPNVGRFLTARARRILPGFWTCLLVVAFAIVPAACFAAGSPVPSFGERLGYVAHNFTLNLGQLDVGGTSAGLYKPMWDGSLWTLLWEVRCYLLVVALGILGLLTRATFAVIALAGWAWAVALDLSGVSVRLGLDTMVMPQRGGLMFCLGALLWLYRDRVRLDPRLALLAAATIPAGMLLVDNYRVIAAPGLAYLVLWTGFALARWPRAVLRHDVSYGVYIYGFPVQQALLVAGWSTGWLLFFVASLALVLPMATVSWFMVERPFLRRSRAGQRALPREQARVKETA